MAGDTGAQKAERDDARIGMLRHMTPNTHHALNPRLCGELRELKEGRATVTLATSDEMRADEQGLVHGGFVFGLADHAAMLAVNHPNVVLGSAEARFLAPVKVGDKLEAHAAVRNVEGKKHFVDCEVLSGNEAVFRGVFVCFIPSQHVLAAQTGAQK
jgi:uncharacterized protein (TIGR00369 family)